MSHVFDQMIIENYFDTFDTLSKSANKKKMNQTENMISIILKSKNMYIYKYIKNIYIYIKYIYK